ncbi:MAG: anion permease [Candidatus Omnitrophica bacterium]|nr:anion permease [Candidatus Omnitrophota bacterium]MBU4303967.1 anion permease [Candidatus Omnitrophota bacterium]MBU4418497.1 anion permease [Candidatus Omnitrophota bacterium]MBU4467852.1 anion permease [Candidatus Omnitrophota bacterium]MCG2707071.1 anion permease [Candidatus Omnitrophota bacterium]
MKKLLIIIVTALIIAFGGPRIGLSSHQAIVASIFCVSIMGVLIYWELRLSFVFLGAGAMLLTRSIDLENLIKFASLDVILFLIGTMILVGMLNDAGFFYWTVTRLLRIKNITGEKLFILIMFLSGALSGLMGEVASIIIMSKIILDICHLIDIDPIPLIIASVLATNIGSSGTLFGNPVGILIAARANLTFEDFMRNAFPVTVIVFIVTLVILSLWYRKVIKKMSEKLLPLRENSFFISLISISTDIKTKVSIGIFAAMLVCIFFHHRIEIFFNLQENSILMMTPIVFAGIALLYRRDRMRHYVEREVEWTSVLFFLFLFALAGAVKFSGVSDIIARNLIGKFSNPVSLSAVLIYSSSILSAALDNTVVVATYIPIVQSLGGLNINIKPLWWAILFGACYGGNITIVGSTANIIAIDILEKSRNVKISFFHWLKIGLVVGIITTTVAYFSLILLIH